MFVMQFGKYKGMPIAMVPKEYLEWLVGHVPLYGELETAVKCTLKDVPVPEGDTEDRVARVVKDWDWWWQKMLKEK